jgi:hypothetical protein
MYNLFIAVRVIALALWYSEWVAIAMIMCLMTRIIAGGYNA